MDQYIPKPQAIKKIRNGQHIKKYFNVSYYHDYHNISKIEPPNYTGLDTALLVYIGSMVIPSAFVSAFIASSIFGTAIGITLPNYSDYIKKPEPIVFRTYKKMPNYNNMSRILGKLHFCKNDFVM